MFANRIQTRPKRRRNFGAIDINPVASLREAIESLRVANSKFVNPEAKAFTGDMLKVSEQLMSWFQAQGGSNV